GVEQAEQEPDHGSQLASLGGGLAGERADLGGDLGGRWAGDREVGGVVGLVGDVRGEGGGGAVAEHLLDRLATRLPLRAEVPPPAGGVRIDVRGGQPQAVVVRLLDEHFGCGHQSSYAAAVTATR